MKPDHGASSGLMPARSPARSIVPVLIRVPALLAPARATAGPRARTAPSRPRRRLRREVRAVGSAVLIGLTTALALVPTWGGPVPARALGEPALASAGVPAPADRDRDPIVSLAPAIEPAGPRECGDSVVLPGTIEPDDRAEEGSHGRN